MPVYRGDFVTVDVQRLGDGPDGLAKIDDYVVFVPGVLPGERATIEITSAARKFGRGQISELQRASQDRVDPQCRHFLSCGGCHLQHLNYDRQLQEKQVRIERAVNFAHRNIAQQGSQHASEHTVQHASQPPARRPAPTDAPHETPPVLDTVAAVEPYGQRHKVVLHLHNDGHRLVPAFHRARSLDLIPISECPASEPAALQLAMRAVELLAGLGYAAWDPDFGRDGNLRCVLVRRTTTGQSHLVIVARSDGELNIDGILDDLHHAGATTISINCNDGEVSRLLGRDTERISGPDRIVEQLGEFDYPISASSFFQTAPSMALKIVKHVVDWLQPSQGDFVADLYCGGGLLTLPLAVRSRHTFGIELSERAITDAWAAADANDVRNVTFRSGHVDDWLRRSRNGDLPEPDLVALDPPRSGLEDQVIEELQRSPARRLSYVSCEPAALQRDLVKLAAAGFRTVKVTPFDMFPQTGHVESVACLERVQPPRR